MPSVMFRDCLTFALATVDDFAICTGEERSHVLQQNRLLFHASRMYIECTAQKINGPFPQIIDLIIVQL